MMTYLYCPSSIKTQGIDKLVDALGATRLYNFDGLNFWDKPWKRQVMVDPGSSIICWGRTCELGSDFKTLNGHGIREANDKTDLLCYFRDTVGLSAIAAIRTTDMDQKNFQYYKASGYVGRLDRSRGGEDLLFGFEKFPDFLSYKIQFDAEYRIHVFNGKVIKTGTKVPREGFLGAVNHDEWKPGMLHPWVRTFKGGWAVKYGGEEAKVVPPTVKSLSTKAIKMLKLTFGVVDVGVNKGPISPSYYVINVKTAPEIGDQHTLALYTKSIQGYLDHVESPIVPDKEAEIVNIAGIKVIVGNRPEHPKRGDICPRCERDWIHHMGWVCKDGGEWPE